MLSLYLLQYNQGECSQGYNIINSVYVYWQKIVFKIVIDEIKTWENKKIAH